MNFTEIKDQENFHSLSSLPNITEIYSIPFLRPNITERKYDNVNHYLDVHYRLLKENLVKPIRDAIIEFKSLKKKREIFKN